MSPDHVKASVTMKMLRMATQHLLDWSEEREEVGEPSEVGPHQVTPDGVAAAVFLNPDEAVRIKGANTCQGA